MSTPKERDLARSPDLRGSLSGAAMLVLNKSRLCMKVKDTKNKRNRVYSQSCAAGLFLDYVTEIPMMSIASYMFF